MSVSATNGSPGSAGGGGLGFMVNYPDGKVAIQTLLSGAGKDLLNFYDGLGNVVGAFDTNTLKWSFADTVAFTSAQAIQCAGGITLLGGTIFDNVNTVTVYDTATKQMSANQYTINGLTAIDSTNSFVGVGINTGVIVGTNCQFNNVTSLGIVQATTGVALLSVAATVQFKAGANGKSGTAVLNGNTAVNVNTTALTANSKILLTIQSGAVLANTGVAFVSTQTPGTGFTIKSTNAGDTATVAWFIFEVA